MKPLIRPFLFTVARLGLFLAVVAWIVGQWHVPEKWHIPSFRAFPANAVVFLSSDGWHSEYRYDRSRFSAIHVLITQEEGWQGDTIFDACGIKIVNELPQRRIAIRHWLVVAVFALFYGVLRWVYRKKPETSPATHQ